MAKKNLIVFFAVSVAVFIYQNLLGPTYSTLLTGLWQAWTPVVSFAGIGLGLWIATFLSKKNFFNTDGFQETIIQFLFYSFILVFLLFALILQKIDSGILQLAQQQNSKIIENLLVPIARQYVLLLLFIGMIPFVFFGTFLGKQFLNERVALRVYKYELIAILFGTIVCIWLLEGHSWQTTVFAIAISSFIAVLSSEYNRNYKKLLIPTTVLIFFLANYSVWDLDRDLNIVTRDFQKKYKINEIQTSWKSFAKTQLLQIKHKDLKYKVISIGDGTGIAKYYSFDFFAKPPPDLISTNLGNLFNPRKVLILFAGSGAELISFHSKQGSAVETFGIEINPAIKKMIFNNQKSEAENFFNTYPSHYIISDNRQFLETTQEKFDSIIYSWSGATLANFSGALIHTTQYSFTKEALKKVNDLLTENGILIILGGNKLNIISALLDLNEEEKKTSIMDHVILLDTAQGTSTKASWDELILLYKKSPWSENSIAMVNQTIGARYKLVLNSDYVRNDNYKMYKDLIYATDRKIETENIWKAIGVKPTLATDDYPFAYRNYPSYFQENGSFWIKLFKNTLTKIEFTSFDGVVWFLIAFTVLLIISLKNKKISFSKGFLSFLAWAPLSAVITLFFLYKAILFLGQPTTAFLTVMLSGQLGSLVGYEVYKRKLGIKPHNLFYLSLVVLFSTIFLFSNSLVSTTVFRFPIELIVIFLSAMILGLSSVTSYFFLGYLEHEKLDHFLSCWSFETLFNGLCIVLGIFLIEELGLKLSMCILISISFTMLITAKTLKQSGAG